MRISMKHIPFNPESKGLNNSGFAAPPAAVNGQKYDKIRSPSEITSSYFGELKIYPISCF